MQVKANRVSEGISSQQSTKRTKKKIRQGSWIGQWLYAWRQVFSDLFREPLSSVLTIMVIAISLTLPTSCYVLWKNAMHAASQWYPAPQLTLYLAKNLDDSMKKDLLAALKQDESVQQISYLSSQDALEEFRSWSGFDSALDMLKSEKSGEDSLENNPLPPVVTVTPKQNAQDHASLEALKMRFKAVKGVDEVRMDDSWFTRLMSLTKLLGQLVITVTALMVVGVFLVISNSIRLSIFSCREAINVQKLIGATDSFILRPFLYSGALLSLFGGLLSLIVTQLLLALLSRFILNTAAVFGTTFRLEGVLWKEGLLLLLFVAIIGWFSAWLSTARYLRRYQPE